LKNKNITLSLFAITLLFITIYSCQKIMPLAPDATTVMDAPLDGLSAEQNKLFLEGSEEFEEVYTSETGLGPIFVASSCVGCHAGDNKGHPFTTLTRFGQSDTMGNTFINAGAPQLQHNFIPGYTGEAIPSGASSTRLVAPIIAGLGFIELVPELDILALADPTDVDGDGISGRANYNTIPNWVVPFQNSISKQGKYICRFGKKASTYNLHQQTVQAFNQDIGITTAFMDQNPFNYLSGANPIHIADPDINNQSVNATVFYVQALQKPLQRNSDDAIVKSGALIFNKINCNGCHKEKLKTGFSVISQLNNQVFYPYTDLLLHDMGSNLDDNYTEGTALTNEWRTAPLWGLGLSPQAQGGKYYLMHDGRARSIEEAILMHEGEAANSKNKYNQLGVNDKMAVLKFLESL
jgi:CxxC motif-containing protein (DUF1111 family)